jgi:hypothetical protein
VIDQVIALSRYRGHEPVITRELIDAACRAYFVDGDLKRPEPDDEPEFPTERRIGVH